MMTIINNAIIKGLEMARKTSRNKEDKKTYTFFIEHVDEIIALTLKLGRKPTIQEVKDATGWKDDIV